MGVYSSVKDARSTGGGNYFEPDHEWIVIVTEVKDFEQRNKDHAFIVECKVLETTCPTCRIGAERSHFIDMKQDAAAGNVKQFIETATLQFSGEMPGPEDMDEAGIAMVYGPQQPFAGLILGLKTWNKPTKKGDPFTRHTYREITPEQVARARAVAEKLGLIKAAA